MGQSGAPPGTQTKIITPRSTNHNCVDPYPRKEWIASVFGSFMETTFGDESGFVRDVSTMAVAGCVWFRGAPIQTLRRTLVT